MPGRFAKRRIMRMHFEPTEFSVKKKEKRVSRTYMNLGGGLNRPRERDGPNGVPALDDDAPTL
jgi:hypothetical protein